MSDVIVMIGVSGSGKSHKAKECQRRSSEIGKFVGEYGPLTICNTDKFIEREAKENGITYQECMSNIQEQGRFKEITGKFYDEIEECIKNDINIIIDRTNLSKGGRIALVEKLTGIHNKYGKHMNVDAICLVIPRELIDERLRQREDRGEKKMDPKIIDQQLERLEIPAKDEGFGHVSIAGDFDEKTGLYKELKEVKQ